MSDKSDSDGERFCDMENSESRPDSEKPEPGADTDKKKLRERLNDRAKRIKLALPAVYLSLRDRIRLSWRKFSRRQPYATPSRR